LILLATAIAQAHFTLIAPLSVSEQRPIELGQIYAVASSECQLLGAVRSGNGCAGGSAQTGQLQLAGNSDAWVTVSLSPVILNDIQLEPLLPGGTSSQQFQLSTTPLIIDVGARVTLLKQTSGGSRSLSYTIEVLYD
jgi:hypothetical protein